MGVHNGATWKEGYGWTIVSAAMSGSVMVPVMVPWIRAIFFFIRPSWHRLGIHAAVH